MDRTIGSLLCTCSAGNARPRSSRPEFFDRSIPRCGTATRAVARQKRTNKERPTGRPLPVLKTVLEEKLEQLKQVADRRAVERNIWIGLFHDGIREVVPAAECHGLQTPVPLDELQDRDVVRVVMRDVSATERTLSSGMSRSITESRAEQNVHLLAQGASPIINIRRSGLVRARTSS